MKRINKKFLFFLSFLLLSSLLLLGSGCQKEEMVKLIVEIKGPDSAQVTIANGKSKTKIGSTPIQFEKLPAGKYKLTVKSKGYKTWEKVISLKEKEEIMKIELEKTKSEQESKKTEQKKTGQEEKETKQSQEPKLYNVTLSLTDKNGNSLDGKATITGEKDIGSKEIKAGTLNFKAIPGKYKLIIEAEGYKTFEKTITIGKEDKELTAILEKKRVNVKVKVMDENQNPLKATIFLKRGNKEIAKKGSKVAFKGLTAGQYQLKITREGYDQITRDINLVKDKTISEVMIGGNIRQYLIKKDGKRENIMIENLSQGKKAIIAVSYLNLDQPPNETVKNNFEYKLRKRENKLIEKYGTNFGFKTPNYSIGDTKEFKISDDVKKGTVKASLEAKGKHIYVFVDKNEDVSQEKIKALVTNFDNNIYPRLTPEPDKKDKVVALLTEFDQVDKSKPYVTGYFNGGDLYQGEGNEQVMLYLNSIMSKNTILTAAAHQYQHLIYFMTKAKTNRTVNDAWINQGLAHVASQLCGYIDFGKKGWSKQQANGWVYDKKYGYLNNTDEVNLLFHDGSLTFTGASGLFTAYLIEQYSPNLIREIMISSRSPVKVIEEYTGNSFEQIYANWITTNVTDNITQIKSDVYNYSAFDLEMMPAFNDQKIGKTGVSYVKIIGQGGDVSLKLPERLKEDLVIVVIKN